MTRGGRRAGPVQRAESGRTGSMAQSTSLKQKRRLLSSRPGWDGMHAVHSPRVCRTGRGRELCCAGADGEGGGGERACPDSLSVVG